jgi:hypothetical protein
MWNALGDRCYWVWVPQLCARAISEPANMVRRHRPVVLRADHRATGLRGRCAAAVLAAALLDGSFGKRCELLLRVRNAGVTPG